MDQFTLLDASAGCHPSLPVNEILDEVFFNSLAPIALEADAVLRDLEVPTFFLWPDRFAGVPFASRTDRDRVIGRLSEAPTLFSSLKPRISAVPTGVQGPTVRLDSLGTLFTSGVVRSGRRTYRPQLTDDTLDQLRRGESVTVPLQDQPSTAGTFITLQPDFPLPGGEFALFTDDAGLRQLSRTGTVQVAGHGLKRIALAPNQAESLFDREDPVTLAFAGGSNASLRVFRVDGGPGPGFSGALRPLPMASASGAFHLNVADRVRFGTRSSPLLGDLQVPAGDGYPGAATNPPPPPPARSGNPLPAVVPEAQSQVPKVSLALYLPYRQTWTLLGYSRGALLNTLSLAPQEEMTIEVFSWDRRKRESETGSLDDSEASTEATFNWKDTREVVDETRKDNSWKVDVGGQIGIPDTPINLTANSNLTDTLGRTARTTTNQIADATVKSATKIKATRQTKVVESAEFGTENKAIRRLRNPNLGRTLSLDAFEVLANYRVETRPHLEGARIGAVVQLYDYLGRIVSPTEPQSRQYLLAFEHVLKPAVPRNLHAGFAAARLLLANERLCALTCAARCPCEPVVLNAARTAAGGQSTAGATQPGARVLAAAAVIRSVVRTLEAASPATLNALLIQDEANLGNAGGRPSADALEAARVEMRRYIFRRFAYERGPGLRFWGAARSFAAQPNPGIEDCRRLIADRRAQPLDLLGGVVALLASPVQIGALAVDLITAGQGRVAADLLVHGGADEAGIEPALNELDAALAAFDTAAARQPATGGGGSPPGPSSGASGSTTAGPGTGSQSPTAPPRYDLKHLAEAEVDLEVLRSYLSTNATLYRTLIWRSINAADLGRLMAIYGRLPELLTGRILGFLGSKAVMELDERRSGEAQRWLEEHVRENGDLIEQEAKSQVALPTPGVSLETRLGRCDGLEDHLVGLRAAELQRANATAAQEEIEIERLKRRLGQDLLENPRGGDPLLRVEMVKP